MSERLIGVYSSFEKACKTSLELSYNTSIWGPHVLIINTNIDKKINYDYDDMYIVNKYEKCLFDKKNNKIVYSETDESIISKYIEILEHGKKIYEQSKIINDDDDDEYYFNNLKKIKP